MNESLIFDTISPVRPLSMCLVWKRPNHVLFQTANVFLLMAYLATNSVFGVLYLRSCLTIGCLFLSLWGWIVLCESDIIVWNVIFTAINAIHVICIVWKLHPFIRFPHDVEMVYRNLFQPLRVSRNAFKTIYFCTREIQTLKSNDIYAIEGRTRVDRLTLLLSGRVSIIRGGRTRVDRLTLLLSGRVSIIRGGQTLHIIDSHQFLDSPEWFGVGSHETYQVSIVALEESRLLVWNRDKLKLSISCDPYLQTLLDNILGKDVVKKLLLVSDSVSNQQTGAGERTKLIIPTHRAMDQLIKRSPINSNGLLPSHYSRNGHQLSGNGVNGVSTSRSILRIREKYVLVVVIIIFIAFSLIGVAFLPELKASNVYKYIKPADSLGPDLLGLVPPLESSHPISGHDSHTARAKIEDKQRLRLKINEQINYNLSQLSAVLPKPNDNGLAPDVTLKTSDSDDNWTPLVLPSGDDPDPEVRRKRDFIKEMTREAWIHYKTYAWGENELRPISKKGHSAGIFGTTKLDNTNCSEMSFKLQSKSLKSNSSLNHSRGHLTGGQHIQHIQQLSQSVTKCIAQDLSLLRPHIQWTPMSHPMPEMTKNAKNQTITEEQLLSDMSEMDTKLDQLKGVIEDEAIPVNDMHFESLSDECNELKTSLPTFRRVVNTFIDKYENQSRDES
ncbi:unnamed protein product, partial [Medioppia subpectinata]